MSDKVRIAPHEAAAERGARRQAVDDLLDYQSGCWRRGERPAVDACLGLRPELGEDDDAVLDLICHEILLRRAGARHRFWRSTSAASRNSPPSSRPTLKCIRRS